MKEQLFKTFANFTRTEKGEITTSGIGLGLSLSQKLVDIMQGSINIDSAESVGTEVIFKIRVNEEAFDNRKL